MNKKINTYDVVIVGGGLSGICAAIAAARNGVNTALIHNRPVLGGNASSEIRMHICGADCHGKRDNARETGILEELLLDNRYRNPQNSYSVFDTILWEKVAFQENLTLYLNTHFDSVTVDGNTIKKVHAVQLTSETEYDFYAKYFVDTTGDGTLASAAGARYMVGRESSKTFNESHAPESADSYTMGSTLLFSTKDMGYPVAFKKPFWANTYTEEDLAHRGHGAYGHNYWWIEIGGDTLNTISDSEVIRDELMKAVYGVWDHIKNGGDHEADNYALDWVGFLPGKRESRRIIGDYILNEHDLLSAKPFEDAIAYGGWPMDMHVVGGLRTKLEPTEFIQLPEVYSVPYRSLYAKDLSNLYIGGRIISASHMAFGSTRIMATCAVVGQAIGTSVSIANQFNISPGEVGCHMDQLQQQLLRHDAYIPNVKNTDALDYARQATVTCSSEIKNYEAANVVNGVSRTVKNASNVWHSEGLSKDGEWIELAFASTIQPASVEVKFDSNLSKQIMLSMFNNGQHGQEKGIPKELVKNYTIQCYRDDSLVYTKAIPDNYQRLNCIQLDLDEPINKIRLHVQGTHGCENARIFELRVY